MAIQSIGGEQQKMDGASIAIDQPGRDLTGYAKESATVRVFRTMRLRRRAWIAKLRLDKLRQANVEARLKAIELEMENDARRRHYGRGL